MTDLPSLISEAIQARKALAEALRLVDWDKLVARGMRGPFAVVAEFAAANSPADVLRQCEADLRRLERHSPDPEGTCWHGDWAEISPCADLVDLAASYAIPTEDPQ